MSREARLIGALYEIKHMLDSDRPSAIRHVYEILETALAIPPDNEPLPTPPLQNKNTITTVFTLVPSDPIGRLLGEVIGRGLILDDDQQQQVCVIYLDAFNEYITLEMKERGACRVPIAELTHQMMHALLGHVDGCKGSIKCERSSDGI